MITQIYKEALAVLAKKPVRLWGISLLGGVLSLVVSILFGVIPGVALAINILLSTGMIMVYLHGFRGEEVKAVHLFDCCKDWGTVRRVLCGLGWQALWLFLWLLIPIVGFVFAAIKTYAWRLTPYILVQEPDIKPTEAIKVSEERTKGYKGKMFGADFLVLGIFFAAVLVLALLSAIPYIGILFGLVLVLVYIAFILFGGLFLGLVQAGFYEKISADNASKRTCPACGTVSTGDAEFCSVCGQKL